MQRIGLALSGGGFRATIFHLGMIRFLREANILPSVTHVASVSGGSILAAHLVLNWHRYTDSLKEFDAAAAEVIRFVQLDIRNRVIRRYPLAMPLRVMRRMALLGPARQLTRTGLLEYHYEKYLYGDTCLFQLPERPRLYILATNVSEGCLCAFTRDGLLMQRRQPGQRFRFDRIHTGLATVPMAVTASSAFPGLFPPLELQGQDVGADPGLFGRLAFTDGGIYDNLGVRMFRCLEQSWMAREIRLEADDLADADGVGHALQAAAQSAEDSPLRRLAQMMSLPSKRTARSGTAANMSAERLLDGLSDVMKHEDLAREPVFASLSPPDPLAQPLLQAAQRDASAIDAGEQLWLNRQLVEAAFRQATGKPCFRSLNVCFDGVLVSDAGKQFKISSNTRAGGLIATAIRASDIAMDRVWQLEVDTFSGTPGFVFAPIGKIVEPEEDPTALHPELQRMSVDIRTDLDRFSPLEISSLIRHGYCVGRSVCRSRPDLFGTDIPTGSPWDPLAAENDKPTRTISTAAQVASPAAVPETEKSRALQQSAGRRMWSTLLDYRDWVSFVYVPILIPIMFVLPYFMVKWYHQSQVASRLIEGLAQSNRDFSVMSKMLQGGPSAAFTGIQPEEIRELTPRESNGIEVMADTRVIDYRPWNIGSTKADDRSYAFGYRRIRLKKVKPTANQFIIHVRMPTAHLEVRPLNDRVPTSVRLCRDAASLEGKSLHVYEIAFDLSKVFALDVVDLPVEMLFREPPPAELNSTFMFVDAETELLTCWLLFPEGKQYENFELMRYPTGKPGERERVVPANLLNSVDGQILAFALLGLKPDYIYECRWAYRK